MSGVFLFLSVVRITLPLPLRYRFRSHNRLSSLFHFLPAHRPPPTTAFAHLQIATVKVYLLGNGYFGPEPLPRNSFLGVHSYSPYTHTIATESVNCGGDGISKESIRIALENQSKRLALMVYQLARATAVRPAEIEIGKIEWSIERSRSRRRSTIHRIQELWTKG